MDVFKKHADTVVVLGAILSSVLWMNHQFNNVDKEISNINKDMAVIKAVLIMKGIGGSELLTHATPTEEKK